MSGAPSPYETSQNGDSAHNIHKMSEYNGEEYAPYGSLNVDPTRAEV